MRWVGRNLARISETPSAGAAIGLLVALAVPLFFVKLGSAGLVDPDEPYYAVPALEMLRSGSWAVPLFHGQPWFDKPVLFYWIVLAAFSTFGVSEWAARFGSALAGLGGAIAVVLLAPERWRRGGAHILAAVVLASSLEYALLSRSAVTDMTLTLFLTLGFLAVARHLESRHLGLAGLGGAAFGLATLTKGPVGLLVPVVALAGYGWATRRRELLEVRPLIAAATGFLATAAPWYLYMLVKHRALVLTVFLGQENLGRFLDPEHRQVPLFYVWVLAGGLMPWSAALPAGLTRAFRDWRRGEDRTGESPGTVFALAWFLAVLAVFSLSASKLATYVLPAFPAAAFLIARYWCDAFSPSMRGARSPSGPFVVACLGAAGSAGAASALVILAARGVIPADGSILGLAALLLVASCAAAIAARTRRLASFAAVQALTTVAFVLVAVVFAWPAFEARESTKTLVRELQADGLADQLAGAYRVRDVSLDFYLGRTLLHETRSEELVSRVESAPHRLWVLPAGDVATIAAQVPLVFEPVMVVSRRAVVRLSPRASSEARLR